MPALTTVLWEAQVSEMVSGYIKAHFSEEKPATVEMVKIALLQAL